MNNLFYNTLKLGRIFLLIGSIDGQEQILDVATTKEDAISKSKTFDQQGTKIQRVLFTNTSEITLGENWLTN